MRTSLPRYAESSARVPQRVVSGAAEQESVDAPANLTEVRFVAGFQFDGGAAGETDFGKSLAHCRPIHVAIAEIHPRISVIFALEVFEMNLDDALAERADPVLRIAIKHDIAHVKPGFDPGAVELIDVRGHFDGTKQELVPDFLDGDDDFELFGKRKELANLRL